MTALNIAVAGASGRMGRMLIEAILNADDLKLSGALDTPARRPSAPMPACSWARPPACSSNPTWPVAWPVPTC
jgi:predicted dehydrogenase